MRHLCLPWLILAYCGTVTGLFSGVGCADDPCTSCKLGYGTPPECYHTAGGVCPSIEEIADERPCDWNTVDVNSSGTYEARGHCWRLLCGGPVVYDLSNYQEHCLTPGSSQCGGTLFAGNQLARGDCNTFSVHLAARVGGSTQERITIGCKTPLGDMTKAAPGGAAHAFFDTGLFIFNATSAGEDNGFVWRWKCLEQCTVAPPTAGFEIVAVLNNANACGSKACPVFRKDMKRGLQSFGPALSYTTDEFAQAVASGEKLTTSYFIRGKSSVSRRTRLAFRLDSTSFLGQVDTSVACEVTVKAQRALSERLSSAAAIAVGVSVALGLVSGPTAATASRLDLLTQECETEDFHNGTLSWALHPTQVTVFESVYAGCIIGNLLIIVTVTVVFMALMFATVHFIPDIVGVSGLLDSSGVLRFPSVPLFFFLFLYQGTVVSTFKLLFYPRSPVDLGVAIPSFVICAGLPLWIARTLRVAVARSLIAYVYDDEKQQDWLVFIAGPGEWVSRSRANHFSQRYTSMLIVFAEERSWYVVFEFLSMFLLGGAMTLRTDSLVKCGHVRFFSGFVNLVFFVVEIIKWPHCRRRDHVLDPSIYLLQAVGLFFLSGGYYQARLEDWTIDAGAVSWRAEAAMDDQVLKDYVTEESSVPEEQNENAVGGELTSRLLEESPAVRRLSMADVFSPKRSSRSLVDRGRRRSIRPGREHLRELQNVTVDDYNEEFGALVSARRVSYVPARLEVTDGPRELAGVYCLCSALTKPPVWVQGTRTICFVDGKRWEIRDAAGVSARSADAKDADGILSPLDVAEWLV
eukprot:gene6936-10665_t